MSLLQADNITKRYGDFAALDRVSLAVPEGAVLALLGDGKFALVKSGRR